MTRSDPGATAPDLLRLRGITKQYPLTLANDRVDLTVAKGEIHALLGENGAGKSTLVKIIYGVVRPDAGEIVWDGTPVTIASPHAARTLGRRHGVPALLALRGPHRRREPCAGDERAALTQSAARRGRVDLDALRPAARPGQARLRPLARRATAHRDRALPHAVAEAAHHGRAHVRADAAGGGQAVRDAAPARRPGLLDPLHLAQAEGDPRAVPRGDRDACGQGGGALRPAPRDDDAVGRADDRRDPGRAARPRWCGCERARSLPRGRAAHDRLRPEIRHRPEGSGRERERRGNPGHRRRLRQRPDRADGRALRRDPRRPAREHLDRGRRRGPYAPPASVARSAPASCRRSATATPPCRP